jgi:hypothetical protein
MMKIVPGRAFSSHHEEIILREIQMDPTDRNTENDSTFREKAINRLLVMLLQLLPFD